MGKLRKELRNFEDSVKNVGRSIDDAVFQPIADVGRKIDDEIFQPVKDTVEAIVEDPKKLAMVALSIMAPGAGTALGVAMGLSGTAATLVGQIAINTALNGGDVKSAIIAAAIPVVGQELAGVASSAFVDAGMDKALADSVGKVVSGAGISAAQGKDPLDALISGGLSAGTAAITRDIPIFEDLPEAGQRAVRAAIAAELTGKDPTQAIINSAISTGINAAKTAFASADFSLPEFEGLGGASPEAETPSGGLPSAQPDANDAASLAPPELPPFGFVDEPLPEPEPDSNPVYDYGEPENIGGLPVTPDLSGGDGAANPETPELPPFGFVDEPLPEPENTGGLPVTPDVSDADQAAPNGGLPVTSEGGDEETAAPGFQGPNGPPTEDTARRQAEEYARYLEYLADPTATPEYAPQQMQISQENLDSYNRNLQDIFDNRGGFTSQWQTAGSDRIMISDDGSGIGMNENGETYPLSPELVDQMVRNGQLNTAESGYVAATGGTGNLPGGSAPSAGTGTPRPTGGLPTTPATPSTPTTPTAPGTVSTPTASSPFGMNWLDTSPQMLKASTSDRQGPAKMAQLRQLYGSLTPEMQSVFADQGISAPEADMPVPAFATGGTTQSVQSMIDSLTPKFAPVPKFLEAAPVTTPQSRMAALRHLRSPKSGQQQPAGMAQGGLPTKYSEAAPQGHKPEFITGVTGYYAQGGGTGQSDEIPAMLHDGDYVIDADAVAAFGDGSSKAGAEVLSEFQSRIPFKDDGATKGKPVAAKIADGEYVFPAAFVTALGRGDNKQGAKILDEMRENLREHKRSAPTSKIPPKAKSPLDYLKTVKG
jgi:hypothetical protein